MKLLFIILSLLLTINTSIISDDNVAYSPAISEENGVAIAYGGLIGLSTASILTLGADAFKAITTAEPPLPPGTTTAIASNQKAAEVFVSMIDEDGSYSPEEAHL